ncbi:MAG TPA: amidohydrolase family protein, partial [Acidimicrobiia bacterium]
AASSDHPCGDWQPLATSRYGANRWTGHEVLGPDQALGYGEWLRAWTAGSAYAGGQEDERGRLIPGARADLVILNGDLDPDDPPTVAQTWVAGRRLHPTSDSSGGAAPGSGATPRSPRARASYPRTP